MIWLSGYLEIKCSKCGYINILKGKMLATEIRREGDKWVHQPASKEEFTDPNIIKKGFDGLFYTIIQK